MHVEPVAERKDADADHRVDRFVPALGQAQRAGHDAKAQAADRARQHEAMLEHAAAKREGADDHRQGQPDFVDDRLPEKSAGRREQAEENRRRNAMHEA